MSTVTKPIILDETGKRIAQAIEALEAIGRPTQEQTELAINEWLDDHPEATTTVEDGSITEAKFTNETLLKIKNNYVTPEMYGAVGNGTTDDTSALQDAIDSGKPVIGINNYKITDTITISGGQNIILTGIIRYAGARTKPAIQVSGRFNNVSIDTIVDTSAYEAGSSYDGGWHGWESDNYVGLDLNNLHQSTVWCKRVVDFTVGIRIAADGTGNFQNNISGKAIMNCKYGIYILTSGEHGWLNSSIIDGFEIVNSSSTWDGNHAGTTRQYGVYQELADGNTYGARYLIFDHIVFELATRDYFTGFYFELVGKSRIRNLVSEITDGATFALFNITTTTSSTVSTVLQYSYDNIFENVGIMNGNKDITFSGDTSAIITSLQSVAKFDTDTWNCMYRDDQLFGKALITNKTTAYGTQGVVKGYSFTRLAYTGALDQAKLGTTQDGSARQDLTYRALYVPATTPISMLLEVTTNETYRVVVRGVRTYTPSVALKAYASDGTIILPTTSREKPIAGNFIADSTRYNAFLAFSASSEYEFTVVGNTVKYIMILIYGELTNIEVFACNNPKAVLYRHWGNLEYLNYCDKDKFYITTTPSSVVNNDTAYIGQRVYDATSQSNMGGYWELTSEGWVHSS